MIKLGQYWKGSELEQNQNNWIHVIIYVSS